MKSKPLLLVLPALLLAGCDGQAIGSDSASVPESEVSTSSESSESRELTESEKLTDFRDFLLEAEGHPNRVEGNLSTSLYYLTDVDYFEMVIDDEFEIERYEGNILYRKGTYVMNEGTPDPYEQYMFVDGAFIYRVTLYEEGDPVEESVVASDSEIENSFAIGFGSTQAQNLDILSRYVGHNYSDVEYTLVLPETYAGDGTYTFSYSLTFYVEGSTVLVDQAVSHECEMLVQDGLIVSSKSTVRTDVYAGGLLANYSISNTEVSYSQGEYAAFTGTLPSVS